MNLINVAMLTKEWPPEIYGGAGVHVEELVNNLRLINNTKISVHCMGVDRPDTPDTFVHNADPKFNNSNTTLGVLSADLDMVKDIKNPSIVHSHTWYTAFAGHIAGKLNNAPHVITAHSLEPLRPWKAEQLGGGYNVSLSIEAWALEKAQAVIAVSKGMAKDIEATYPNIDPKKIHVIYNGIDPKKWFKETFRKDLLSFNESLSNLDYDKPIVTFVGRITHQKGLKHLLKAALQFDPEIQLILCAGAPDTKEIADETKTLVSDLKKTRSNVYWLDQMLEPNQIRKILSVTDVFVCPSIYEPLGIVNLEAMACGCAVVASDVGGIPEVVNHNETGLIVHYDKNNPGEFETEFAKSVNYCVANKNKTELFAQAGLNRAITDFSWLKIASETLELYKSLL